MRRAVSIVVLLLSSGCGDALLPADYSGPPADQIGGVVLFDRSTNAVAPRLSLQWLAAQTASQRGVGGADVTEALVEQKLHFQRSSTLTADWTIALYQPADGTHTRLLDAPSHLRLLLGKLAYFDDLDGDGRMTWTCGATRCDRLLSISSEYVVFTPKPIRCDTGELSQGFGRPGNVQLAAGYHYFRYTGDRPEALAGSPTLTFLGVDGTPAEAERLVRDLDAFADALVRGLRVDALGGCGTASGQPYSLP